MKSRHTRAAIVAACPFALRRAANQADFGDHLRAAAGGDRDARAGGVGGRTGDGAVRAGPRGLPASRWDERCSAILRRMAGRHHDREICDSIAAETGKRFMPRTVAEYRRAGDLPPCRRNDWTVALKTLPRR